MTITEAQMRGIAAELVDTYVDVDGAAGNQCWDSQAYINSHYFGLPIINTGGPGRWPGWAGNMVDAFPQSAAIAAAYELVSPDQPCQPGDTLVWGTSYPEWYPKTHVANCVMDPGNGWPLCLSQNSSTARPDLPGYSPDSTGPVILQSLPKQGLIGIIRPRDTGAINFQSATPAEQDVFDIMTATPEEQDAFIQRLLNYQVTQPDGNKNSLGALLQESRGHHLDVLKTIGQVPAATYNLEVARGGGGDPINLGTVVSWMENWIIQVLGGIAALKTGAAPADIEAVIKKAIAESIVTVDVKVEGIPKA